MFSSLYNMIAQNWPKSNPQSEDLKNKSDSLLNEHTEKEEKKEKEVNKEKEENKEKEVNKEKEEKEENKEKDENKEINEINEIKSLILDRAKFFIDAEKTNKVPLQNVTLNISDKALEKFLNAVKNVLKIYNKEINKKNTFQFIERETEFMYFGIYKLLANDILENGWSSCIRTNKKINSHEKGDYFTNLISTSHHTGGDCSVVILSLVIKPDFTGRYHNVIKCFTDSPYNMKWNFIIDNKSDENYSLGLAIVSDNFESGKASSM
jgi:hypothetical protein